MSAMAAIADIYDSPAGGIAEAVDCLGDVLNRSGVQRKVLAAECGYTEPRFSKLASGRGNLLALVYRLPPHRAHLRREFLTLLVAAEPVPGEVDARLADIRPQMLRMDDAGRSAPCDDPRARVGRLVERCLAQLELPKKAAALTMGYRDQSVVSRWCAGTERPHFDKLLALDGFTVAWLLELAKMAGDDVTMDTVIRVTHGPKEALCHSL